MKKYWKSLFNRVRFAPIGCEVADMEAEWDAIAAAPSAWAWHSAKRRAAIDVVRYAPPEGADRLACVQRVVGEVGTLETAAIVMPWDAAQEADLVAIAKMMSRSYATIEGERRAIIEGLRRRRAERMAAEGGLGPTGEAYKA